MSASNYCRDPSGFFLGNNIVVSSLALILIIVGACDGFSDYFNDCRRHCYGVKMATKHHEVNTDILA